MAAMLDRNGADGKSAILPASLTNREVIGCADCAVSYTLAFGSTENRIERGENVLSLLRFQAQALISDGHPTHSTETYVWGGIDKGWLDREKARAAGL